MQPALNPTIGSEDYVFLSKWSVKSMQVERGEIISLISPKDPSQKLIKRIVGLQGIDRNLLSFCTDDLKCIFQVTLYQQSATRSHMSKYHRAIVGLKAIIQDIH